MTFFAIILLFYFYCFICLLSILKYVKILNITTSERVCLLLYLILEKLKEVILSVLPITIIVLILHFTITPIDNPALFRFLIGAFIIILGLSIFLFGVDIGVTPIGNLMGNTLAKSNKLWIVAIGGLLLGFFISIAEPDLHILAEQVELVTNNTVSKMGMVLVVSIGIAVLVALGLLRVILSFPIHIFLLVAYIIILLLGILAPSEFLAMAFDASGATTGAMTVPFLLALNMGVTILKHKKGTSEEDSFGLVGIASAGAIMPVLLLGIIMNPGEITHAPDGGHEISTKILLPFIKNVPHVTRDVIIALIPLVVIFFVFQFLSFKLGRKQVGRIIRGLIYTFIGLVLFLTGVNAGFMDVGRLVGEAVAGKSKVIVVIIGLVLGMVTILAEPAVYVLTKQIEDVTSGSIKRRIVLPTLSIGVGLAVALSMVRTLVPSINLWHYLLPGYIIALILTFFVPRIFVGMAFDSGGVASGPMTATFILAFSQGVASHYTGNTMEGFGMIAMVALTPLIVLQVLGLLYKLKLRKSA